MLLVKLITLRRIKVLARKFELTDAYGIGKKIRPSNQFFLTLTGICLLQIFSFLKVSAQDNSPYSRYGLGDLHPGTNVLNRGMGGISAGFANRFSINFSNPATYSTFEVREEKGSRKLETGRVILDVGLNLDRRTLSEADNPERFTSTNVYFSYLQLGIPIRKNWGVTVGLRPLSKINYKIEKRERLYDPNTNLPIDSAVTEFIGDGGAFLASAGTGFAVKNFSLGLNFGYLFGKKDYSTRRTLINDSVEYHRSNHQTKASFGDIFLNAGAQYKIDLNRSTTLRFGVFGNLKQDLNARRDIIRETFSRNPDAGDLRLDSVTEVVDEKGVIVYPASFGAGLTIEKLPGTNNGGWLLGADYIMNGWDDYRFYGQTDAVKNNWYFKLGGHIKPAIGAGYWNFVEYRAGISIGEDYVNLNKKLPELGFSFGIGLPVLYLKDPQRRFRTQQTMINLALEYIKRGKNDNPLKEDLFRLSVGFALSDFWFTKRKYD